jgi:nicotinamide mononucleotide (NMN) deamidase PncC
MEGLRAATEEYAALNASRVKDLMGSTWGLAETGATGPTGNRYGDAAGHSCIALSGPVNLSVTLETGLSDREQNMVSFTKEALNLLLKTIPDSGD